MKAIGWNQNGVQDPDSCKLPPPQRTALLQLTPTDLQFEGHSHAPAPSVLAQVASPSRLGPGTVSRAKNRLLGGEGSGAGVMDTLLTLLGSL